MREPGIPSSASEPTDPSGAQRMYQPVGETRPDHLAAWDEADDWGPDDGRPMLTGQFMHEPDHDVPADERRTGRTVLAEWALWGKKARDPEYSVLRCSNGPFGLGDFRSIITRYAPGTNDALPQYTVCWIPDENDHEGYLAVGIHELAHPDPRRAGGRVRASRGREIEYIRLFCVRYSEMAKQQVGYAELVESVLDYQLPAGPTDPITVELLETESPPLPARLQALAKNVATLLLTTRPVCVLVADDDVMAAEFRLRFIDQVMSLLPYGLRSTMSASTWASATAKNLKLRLFFTSAERDDGGTTVHVKWGQPVRFDFSAPENTPLRHYANWLERGGEGALAELAGQGDPVRFDPAEIRQMIANLPRDRPVRDVLEELADGLRHSQLTVVRAAVKRLRQRRARPQSLDERKKYRQDIKRLGLFKEHPGLPQRTQASVYRALLELTYGPGLSYASYCEIEDCAGGPPGAALGREMLKLNFSTYMPWLLTLKSATDYNDQKLMESLHQQGIEPPTPITEFCRHTGAVLPAHRPVGYDFAVRYLRAHGTDPRTELSRRGYLSETLDKVFPHDQRAQRARLKEMLAFVHGGMLSEAASAELLSRPDVRHTPAFEAAVAELTVRLSDNPSVFATLWKSPWALYRRGRDAQVTLSGTALVLGLMAIAVIMAIILFTLLFRAWLG